MKIAIFSSRSGGKNGREFQTFKRKRDVILKRSTCNLIAHHLKQLNARSLSDLKQIARICNVHLSHVKRIAHRVANGASLVPKKPTGRKNYDILGPAGLEFMKQLLRENPAQTLKEIAINMSVVLERPISPVTIHRRLKKINFTRKKASRVSRLKYLTHNMLRGADYLVWKEGVDPMTLYFMDEATFKGADAARVTARTHVYSPKGDKPQIVGGYGRGQDLFHGEGPYSLTVMTHISDHNVPVIWEITESTSTAFTFVSFLLEHACFACDAIWFHLGDGWGQVPQF